MARCKAVQTLVAMILGWAWSDFFKAKDTNIKQILDANFSFYQNTRLICWLFSKIYYFCSMKIAIFGRLTENTDIQALVNFFRYLSENNMPFLVYNLYYEQLIAKYAQEMRPFAMPTFSSPDDLAGVRFLYSFGGDGTVLECVRLMGNHQHQIPILGVNFGRLGYLTSVSQHQAISATEALLRDSYRIDERGLLSIISDPVGIFGNKNFGLNDLTLHKSSSNEMITVHVYVNGEFLNSYKGDGLIIATPTGSTAYSLACGGPIIFPTSENFIITPVSPHSLTVRPVVISDTCVISCEVASRSGEAMAALDTRTEIIKAGTSIAIKKADFRTKLVRMLDSKYIDTLRKTLMWGSDARK